MRDLLTAAAVGAVVITGMASPASAAPVTQPGGATVDIDRIVLHTGADEQGTWMASGYMEGAVTNLPAGVNELQAQLDVDITVGCVNKPGRALRKRTTTHEFGASWRAWNPETVAGTRWGPRIGLGEDFGMSPYPWELLQEQRCPKGLRAAVVDTEVTSATVQYSHDGVDTPAIDVQGVFSFVIGDTRQAARVPLKWRTR